MKTNEHTGTRIDEIGDGIYRINTPVEIPNGAFSFNQYLVADDEPLLFHTGPRKLFPFVREAGSDEQRHDLLGAVAAGGSGTVAVAERPTGWDLDGIQATLTPAGDDWVLDGTKHHVVCPAADQAPPAPTPDRSGRGRRRSWRRRCCLGCCRRGGGR